MGFTLAEMMVVMLVVSLVTVAMLPVMTVRSKASGGGAAEKCLWEWAVNKSDIYFGLNDTQGAVIGADALAVGEKARLVLNVPDSWGGDNSHLVLKQGNDVTGRLWADRTGNVAFGQNALISNIYLKGYFNTANGASALYSNTVGYSNTANGTCALRSNTTGFVNTASGLSALYSNTVGYSNTANGALALRSNTTGSYNTASGVFALDANATGNYNTASGVFALDANATGNYNTGVGAYVDVTSGALSYATGIGAYATVSSSNSVAIGRPTDSIYAGTAGLLLASDKRLKDIKGFNTSGLSEIRKINVYNYTLKGDKQKKLQVGVIAQDIQKIFPNAISENAGYLHVNYGTINMALINALKELDKLVQELKQKVAVIFNIQAAQAREIKQLEAKIIEQNKALQTKDKQLELRLLKLEQRK